MSTKGSARGPHFTEMKTHNTAHFVTSLWGEDGRLMTDWTLKVEKSTVLSCSPSRRRGNMNSRGKNPARSVAMADLPIPAPNDALASGTDGKDGGIAIRHGGEGEGGGGVSLSLLFPFASDNAT